LNYQSDHFIHPRGKMRRDTGDDKSPPRRGKADDVNAHRKAALGKHQIAKLKHGATLLADLRRSVIIQKRLIYFNAVISVIMYCQREKTRAKASERETERERQTERERERGELLRGGQEREARRERARARERESAERERLIGTA